MLYPSSKHPCRIGGMSDSLKYILRSILLMVGMVVGSTSVIFIRASTEQPYLVAAYRLWIAAVVLTPFFLAQLRRSGETYTWKHLKRSALPALALAIHFMSWVVGGRMTPVANASLLVNMVPVALPFILWILYREMVNRAEVAATILALSGVLVLSGASFQTDRSTFIGNLICIGSMLAYATYLGLGRRNRATTSLWIYLIPLYYLAGLVCFIAALFYINPIKAYDLENILYILGLGLLPTVIAHSVLNYSLRYFRGQVVGVATAAQPISAVIMGFIFFGEVPPPVFYLAALLVGGAIVIALFKGKANQRG